MTVGTASVSLTVPEVRSTGPIPRMPSTPSKPAEEEATPMDWEVMIRPEARVTVSVSGGAVRTASEGVTDANDQGGVREEGKNRN